jgi:hypothetical protein
LFVVSGITMTYAWNIVDNCVVTFTLQEISTESNLYRSFRDTRRAHARTHTRSIFTQQTEFSRNYSMLIYHHRHFFMLDVYTYITATSHAPV